MSTILEALKKSERERKLNNVPTLTDMPAPQEQQRWPILVLLCLLISTIIAATVFFVLWYQSNNQYAQPAGKQTVLGSQSVATASTNADPNAAIVVNVVSYSDEPRQRFVMINGRMYREGEFVKAGMKVDAIQKNSVILNNRGRRIERHP